MGWFSDIFAPPERLYSPTEPLGPAANAQVIGAIPTTPRHRIEKRLRIYQLALEQNEKGEARGKVLRGYIKAHELRLEAVLAAEKAAIATAEAEAGKQEG